MQVTTTDTQKRTRVKSAPVATPKTAARARKAPVQAQESTPMLGIEPPTDLTDLIATTAYFLAAERHFMPGRELDDWLEAERRVRAQLNA